MWTLLGGLLEISWDGPRGPETRFAAEGCHFLGPRQGPSPDAPQTAQDGPDGPPGRGTGGSLTGAFFEGFHGLKSGHFAGEGC